MTTPRPKTRPVLATMLLTAAGVQAGCAGQNTAGPAPTDLATATAVFDRLVTQVYGTSEQRSAGAEYAHLSTQRAIAECAKARGITYPIPAFTNIPPPNSIIAPGDLSGFAPLLTSWGIAERVAKVAQAGDPVSTAYLALKTDTERTAYMGRLGECQNAGSAFTDAAFPTGQAQLDEQFLAVLEETQKTPAVAGLLAGYTDCLGQAGFKARSYTDLYQQADAKFGPAIEANTGKPTDVTHHPAYTAAMQYELDAAAADALCRTSIRPAAITAARPELSAFATSHAAQLTANTDGFAKTVTALASLKANLHS
ncbi:hypothetical protein F4553_000099 [Allocatelliglobosispora scoriae]|uniref:Lipoprotein n=1 Tax=Allocatelliglobosispora scoriae TaxID=643052 RepID=A0A841BIS8_9ACTN|nr:hypothetical protein [Allocatelliglobosispora scoriae]MBB5866720.1 hypothetical protein [Allocatelliglobosispora scoriae]